MKTLIYSLLIGTASLTFTSEINLGTADPSNKICRILSLSGGGSKGIYEVGALDTM